jgi:hypothetical protein
VAAQGTGCHQGCHLDCHFHDPHCVEALDKWVLHASSRGNVLGPLGHLMKARPSHVDHFLCKSRLSLAFAIVGSSDCSIQFLGQLACVLGALNLVF